MQEEERFPTETRYELLRGVLIGLLGLLLIAFIFPQPVVSTLSHEVLHLPRPGAGIGLIYGPIICLLLRLGRLWGGGLLPIDRGQSASGRPCIHPVTSSGDPYMWRCPRNYQ